MIVINIIFKVSNLSENSYLIIANLIVLKLK